MLQFFLLLLLLLLNNCNALKKASDEEFRKSVDKMADEVNWPSVCENHPWAADAKAKDLENDEGFECVLKFNITVAPEDRTSLCADMYPDDLISQQGDDNSTTCTYRRFQFCSDGDILIKGRCFTFNEKLADYDTAAAECEKKDGQPAYHYDTEDLRWLVYLWNPTRWFPDVFTVWVDRDSVMVFRRALVANGEWNTHLPGSVIEPKAKEHRFFCILPGKKLRASYKRFCDVAKNSFGLAASFEAGLCFMVSPSVYSPIVQGNRGKTRDEITMSIEHYHKQCKWLSDNDYAVGPNTYSKWTAMKHTRINVPWLERSRLLIPGIRVGKEYFLYFNIAGSETYENLHNSNLWAKNHPKEASDAPHDGLALGLKEDTDSRIVDVPVFFRGHLVCASGVSKDEVSLTDCETKYGAGWKGALRDDGTVMCIKVFFKELKRKIYSEVREFCKQQGGFVAPIASAEEQKTLFDLMQEARLDEDSSDRSYGGGVFLGAQKVGDMSAKHTDAQFEWEYDKMKVVYNNWSGNEPDNQYHHDLKEHNEKCISAYASKDDNRYGTWYDQSCDTRQEDQWRIIGGVCAKPL